MREARLCLALVGGVEDGVAVARALGHVHRQVGAMQQLGGGGPVLGEQRDADARRHVDRSSSSIVKACSQACWIFQAIAAAALEVGRVRGQDRELVAAEPGDGVPLAQRGHEPRADLLEQRVAAVVSERVVDLLEPVQVHHEHRPPLVGSLAPSRALARGAR